MKTLFSAIGLLILFLLAGCGASNQEIKHPAAMDLLNAEMFFHVGDEQGQQKTISIFVKNPESLPIQSVRAWIKFDPAAVRITDLKVEEERLSLVAPGETDIDSEEGLVKIGVASSEAISEGLIKVASFKVLKIGTQPAVLTFYDWRAEGDGHTAVLFLEEREAINILKAPSSISL